MRELFTQERIGQLIVSAIIIGVAFAVWFIFSKTYKRIRNARRDAAPKDRRIGTITAVVLNVVKGLMILVIATVVLEVNGINVTSLIAGFGIASAIVGLALQDFLKDVIMGLHIVGDDFFRVGDVIRYGETEGVVTSFNLRTTKVRLLLDSSVMTICNRNISEITQISGQVFLGIPLAYEENLREIQPLMEALCSRAAKIEGVAKCCYLGLTDLEESSVTCKVMAEFPPERKLELRRKVLGLIYEGLQEANVVIPFNQLDVHLDKQETKP